MNNLPQFKRRRLTALIASALFLHACSTLPDLGGDTEDGGEAANRQSTQTVGARSGNVRQNRAITVPARPDVVEPEEEQPSHANTVWIRISNGMQFALDIHNEQIEEEIRWFQNNPNYLAQVTERATPFIFKVVEEIERRGMPMELALLPVIESAYNPSARSSQNAAGLWQFMAPTATSLGLKRDWWYDGRHDPAASTRAAMDYLEALYAQFDNDWLLALAAYNAGQGNVQRAIRNNTQRSRDTDFWALALPRETLRHVPRLIGLAHVMADPDAYGITLSDVPDRPLLASVDAGSQIDLTLVANLAGVEPETIYQLNPGYLQWATHPDGPHTIWLPIEKVETFENNLMAMGDARITWDRYVIQPGDTLGAIAQRFRTQVGALQQVNNLSGSRIIAGQSLLIPRAYQVGEPLPTPSVVLAAANQQPIPSGNYVVRSGDSLWRIASRYRMSVNELAQWNNLNPEAVLRPGQQLVLQPPAVAATSALETDSEDLTSIRYTVRSGDSLARIARQHGVSINELTQWNGIRRNTVIHPGQELIIHPTGD